MRVNIMKKTSTGISFIIHTKNEEGNIKDCILSAKDIVDEILIFDMGSTDKTVAIARSFGAKIFNMPDSPLVDNDRNFGLSKTKLPWILSFDADERLTKNLKKIFVTVAKEEKYDVVIAPRKNIRFKKWIKYSGLWPDAQPILWRKGFLKWPKNMKQSHINPLVKGRILRLEDKEENAFVHYNSVDLKHFMSKFLSYSTEENLGKFFDQKNITFEHLVNYCEGEFKNRYIDEKGYLDGMHGFVFSKFREFYRFVEFVNWWERKGYPEVFTSQDILKFLPQQETGEVNAFRNSKVYKIWRTYHKQKAGLLQKIKKTG